MCRVSDINCCYDQSLDGAKILESSKKRARISGRGAPFALQEIFRPPQDEPGAAINARASESRSLEFGAAQRNVLEGSSESAHIVGPILANDVRVVEQYISPEERAGNVEAPYNVYSNDKEKPILYTKVSRRRPGSNSKGCAGAKQREILEQIIRPFANELVDLYAKPA